jgi:fructose-1,6-bisphosphatase II
MIIKIVYIHKPRHRDLVSQIRGAGARIQLQTDGDVAGALIAVDHHSEVDLNHPYGFKEFGWVVVVF